MKVKKNYRILVGKAGRKTENSKYLSNKKKKVVSTFLDSLEISPDEIIAVHLVNKRKRGNGSTYKKVL
jgi:hypothetical protein